MRSRHKPQVSFCCLFGSVATASAHPGSDVDLAVVLTVPIGR
ncbi:MAG: nucleotidyltransferase domain-containing protein [Egibacteraceae bacterium]